MNTVRGTRAKICGLTLRADAETAAAEGASYLGVVLTSGGPRSITPRRAAGVLADLPVSRVGVFVDASLVELERAAETARLDVIQLHGDESPDLVERLRTKVDCAVWKAVRARNREDFKVAIGRYGAIADGILVDGWSSRGHGGTGTRFPWEAVADQRTTMPPELLLVIAGGLRADNLTRAIALLHPDIVDVSSGVERSPGIKDPASIREFMRVLRSPISQVEQRATHV